MFEDVNFFQLFFPFWTYNIFFTSLIANFFPQPVISFFHNFFRFCLAKQTCNLYPFHVINKYPVFPVYRVPLTYFQKTNFPVCRVLSAEGEEEEDEESWSFEDLILGFFLSYFLPQPFIILWR